MDHEQEPEPKISLLETILIGGFFLILDIVEIALFIFALDDFWIIDIIVAPIFFYLFLKGVPPMRQLVCWLVELFPWVGALPLLTIGWALTVWTDRHQESVVAKVATTAAALRAGKTPGVLTGKMSQAGARSLERIERNEQRSMQLQQKFGLQGKDSSSGSPTNIQVAGKKGGRGSEYEESESDSSQALRPGAQLAKEIYEEQNPMRRMRELFTETPQAETEKNDDTVQVEDDGTVDLRKAA